MGLADIKSFAGKTLFTSEPLEITVEQIQQYCTAIGQLDWFHFDEERARASDFGGIVAPGTLAVALLHPTYFAHVELVNLRGLFRGIDSYRIRGPIIAGDRLTLTITVKDIDEREDGFAVGYEFDWRNADSGKTISTGAMSVRYWPDSADA